MKKILAILLAMMLVLSMGVAAFADEPVTPEPSTAPTGSEAKTFTFSKTYQTSAGETPATIPSESLKFNVTAADGNPDDTKIIIADHTVVGNPGSVTVSVPSYSTVGKWNYTVKEVAGNTQGVTYTDTEFGVQVTVTYVNGNLVAETSFTTKDGSNKKIEGIVNKYDLGNLTVTKTVDGNLASKTQKFDIDVTFTSSKPVASTISGAVTILPGAWTTESDGTYSYKATVSLANGETATFNNIPVGVSYTVEEQAKHTAADANGSNPATGYTATYVGQSSDIIVEGNAATVTNTKGTTPDTGITTDSLPYIMLLGFVVLAGAAMLIKRRAARHN